MRRIVATLLILGPLLAACGKAEEPMIPELKGNWGSPGILAAIGKQRAATIQKANLKPDPPAKPQDLCRATHVTFDKSGIHVHALGMGFSLFDVTGLKREGSRLILTGTTNKRDPKSAGKIVLLVRNGEVRFDDIMDAGGHSLKYARVPEGERVQRYGAATVGEALGLFLNARPCPAA